MQIEGEIPQFGLKSGTITSPLNLRVGVRGKERAGQTLFFNQTLENKRKSLHLTGNDKHGNDLWLMVLQQGSEGSALCMAGTYTICLC